MSNIDKKICNLQDEIMNMKIGMTKIISGRAVTKWSTESYEIDTYGKDHMCSEHIAEEILGVGQGLK